MHLAEISGAECSCFYPIMSFHTHISVLPWQFFNQSCLEVKPYLCGLAKIRPLFERLLLFPIVYPPTPVNRGLKKYVLHMSGSCESECLLDSVLAHHGRVALDPSECRVSFQALKMDTNTPDYTRDQDLPCLSSGN